MVEGCKSVSNTQGKGRDDETPEKPVEIEIIKPGEEKYTDIVAPGNKRRMTAAGEYVPSPTEHRLLEVALDPFHRLASVSKQCELAGISRAHYYRLFNNREFVKYYNERLIDLIRAQSGQLVNIAVREARKGSFPHLKVLLEMGGLYAEKKTVEHEGEVGMTVRFVDPDSDE